MQIITKTPTTLMTTPTLTRTARTTSTATPTPTPTMAFTATSSTTAPLTRAHTTALAIGVSAPATCAERTVPETNDLRTITPIAEHIEALRGFVELAVSDAVVEAAIEGYLDAMTLGAAHDNAVKLLIANAFVASETRVDLLTQQLAVRDREALALRSALALAYEEAAGHPAKPVASDTATESDDNGTSSAKNSVASDYSSEDASAPERVAVDDAVDAEDEGEPVNYKRKCVVLQALLDDQKKHHARAMGEALQRSMALETLLAQARAKSVAAVAASEAACGRAQEDTVQWTATTTTTPCVPAGPPAAASTLAPHSAQAALPIQVVGISQDEQRSSAAATPPAAVEPRRPPALQTPLRIVAPKIIVPASLLSGVPRASLRVGSVTPPVRDLLWPGWAGANASLPATERAVATTSTPVQPRTRLTPPRPVGAVQATTTASTKTTQQHQNKNKHKKVTATAAAAKAKQIKASVMLDRPRWR